MKLFPLFNILTWRIFLRPDGITVILDKFLFRRSEISPLSDQKFVGTWQAEHAGVKSFFILTATHWMVIENQKKKFSKAWGGVYTVEGNHAPLSVLYGTENDKSMSAGLKG